jgi:hypothetical protein
MILAVILLAILSVIGVGAVRLASEERRNASTKARYDALQACARAAQVKVWAELAKYGPNYLKSATLVAEPETFPGGISLRAPAHYSDATSDDADVEVHVNDVVVLFDKGVSTGALAISSDLTNRAGSIDALNSGKAYRVVGRCKDSHGREFEVEFAMRFTLF